MSSTSAPENPEVKREEASYVLAERGDFIAVQTATVANVLDDGERVDHGDLVDLREALEEIERALVTVERLRDLE